MFVSAVSPMKLQVPSSLLGSSASAADIFAHGCDLLLNRNLPEAMRLINIAAKLGYQPDECAAARWQYWMLLGDLERAWQESDRIAKSGTHDPHRFWNGCCWKKRKVMIRCLHGLGDTIQFIRYAPLLRQTCDSLVVQTHPQLVTLIECVPGINRVVTWSPANSEHEALWDVQLEVTELARAFRSTISNLPQNTPYIAIPKERLAWAGQWFNKDKRPRVGIAWQAGPWDSTRSIQLSELAPLLATNSCQFYCLQSGVDPNALAQYPMLRNIEAHSADVLDTAALITQMDLVISVDTMTAHLSGALARPVWIMLPARADWRWMLSRTDSPWYPTARLFRQTQHGDWQPIIAELTARLGVDKIDV
jgi:hypothetical protein